MQTYPPLDHLLIAFRKRYRIEWIENADDTVELLAQRLESDTTFTRSFSKRHLANPDLLATILGDVETQLRRHDLTESQRKSMSIIQNS